MMAESSSDEEKACLFVFHISFFQEFTTTTLNIGDIGDVPPTFRQDGGLTKKIVAIFDENPDSMNMQPPIGKETDEEPSKRDEH